MSTPKFTDDTTEPGTGRGGVQSVEVGMRVLKVIADAGGRHTLGRIAASAGMQPAKAHRYLVSLMRAGFVERDSQNRYALGAEALRVGLVALARVDVVDSADAEMQKLRQKIAGTLLLAIWGTTGPTIVRWIESTHPVTVNVRAGSAMPLMRSATGQIFAAYLPEAVVWPHIERELQDLKNLKLRAPSVTDIRRRLAEIRTAGLAVTDGEMLPGVLALAAPLFNGQHDLVGVIAALGADGLFDNSPRGETARALRDAARSISQRLGASFTS